MMNKDFVDADVQNGEEASTFDEWMILDIACPNENCTSRMDMCSWACQEDDQTLFISCYGIIECRNKKECHSGRVIDWVFFHDDCSADPFKCGIDFPKLRGMLIKYTNKTFIATLSKHLPEQMRTGPQKNRSLYAEAMHGDIGEMENVDYTEHYDIQKFDFTKRTPPLLFDDDSISDSAKTTCNTIVVGFEMTVSQLILVHRSALTKSLGKTERGSKMQTEIERNKHIWFHDKNKEMYHRISQLKELLIAIDNKDYDEIMRIYYRSQHIHTFAEDSCPFPVHVYIEKDRLNMKWLPHIQNAIEKVSVAAPGIKFIQTKQTFDVDDGSTNYIQIGIDDPDLREDAYTSYAKGYPFIHLGDDWNPDEMKGTSIHELLHALGFSHGMARFDSNLYLDINTEGLDAISAFQYERNPLYRILTRFDPFSIMMYEIDEDIMKKVKGDPIWDLKEPEDTEQPNDLSELDKLALNLMYKPCKSDSKYVYAPVLSETTNMLYCGRDVMQSHNQNVPPTLTSICGPNIWANCTSCRVFTDVKCHHGKEIKINTIQRCLKEGKWQGLSGNFYCGRKFADEFITFRFDTCITSDGVCGPDQGIPCTDCGGKLKPGYSYIDFNPIPRKLLEIPQLSSN